HQVGLDRQRLQQFQKPSPVNDARSAADSDDQALGGTGGFSVLSHGDSGLIRLPPGAAAPVKMRQSALSRRGGRTLWPAGRSGVIIGHYDRLAGRTLHVAE